MLSCHRDTDRPTGGAAVLRSNEASTCARTDFTYHVMLAAHTSELRDVEPSTILFSGESGVVMKFQIAIFRAGVVPEWDTRVAGLSLARLLAGAGLAFLFASAVSAPASARQIADFFLGQVRPVFESYCPVYTVPADGRLLRITDNVGLYSIIGCRFGGDCQSTFAVPDLRGRTPVGAGLSTLDQQTYQLGQRGGEPRALGVNELPPHTHAVNASQGGPNTGDPTGALPPTRSDGLDAFTPEITENQTVQFNGQTLVDTGGAGQVNTYHPVLAINYCIQVQGVFPPRP